jgi:SAM-dependent methyltransferase
MLVGLVWCHALAPFSIIPCLLTDRNQALAPYITQSIGVDISESMVNEYNAGAMNQGIPESEMHAVVGNLISVDESPSASLSSPSFHDFDIAAVGLGFHHFVDPALAAKRLGERLKVGGTLLIIDFLPHGHDHSLNHKEMQERGVTHMGFSEDDVKGLFEGAGVGRDFEYVVLGKGIVFTKEGASLKREVFMAKGRKS